MHTIQDPNVWCTQEYETQVTIKDSPFKKCQIINATCKVCRLWWNQQKLTFFWSMTILPLYT
jgi:hypothetical protein